MVTPLANVAAPAGDPLGQVGGPPVEQSTTVVPLPLGDFLSSGHLVVVYASPQEVDVPVACGDIGGALGADGALAVGLDAVNGSKLDGVAYFVPTPAGDATTVTLLLMGGQGTREHAERDRDRAAEADGSARAGENGIAGADGQDGADGQPCQPGQPGADGAPGGLGGAGGDYSS